MADDTLEWEARVHHLLWENYVQMQALAESELAGSELTLAVVGTLDMIGTWPGATVAELSRQTPKTQQAISQLVAKLEQAGYVERRVRPGRGVGLQLTPAGERARAEGEAQEERLEQRLKELLGEDLYDEMLDVLAKARRRLRNG